MDFASNLFLGMGMLRKFDDSDLRLLACECGESVGQRGPDPPGGGWVK